MTEGQWRQAMDMFLAGATDAEIGRHFDLSNTTVARQRFNRGVYRVNRPATARSLARVVPAPGGGEGEYGGGENCPAEVYGGGVDRLGGAEGVP